MAETAGATSCKQCGNPSNILFDGCCAACWSQVEVGRLRAEIADLRRKLQQAQEERDRADEAYSTGMIMKSCEVERVEAERGAAIERGKEMYYIASNACQYVGELQVRAEAAERTGTSLRRQLGETTRRLWKEQPDEEGRGGFTWKEATVEQRALAEARLNIIHCVDLGINELLKAPEDKLHPVYRKWLTELTRTTASAFFPAEALRAEHRSPQSGQEEGDDD